MKVSGLDRKFLQSVNPDELAEYLRGKGWHEKGRLYDAISSIWA